MLIEIKSVSAPYVKNKYGRLDLEYVSGGKPMKKTLTAVGETKQVIQKLKEASEGENWEIKMVKDGDYWNWVDAELATGKAAETKTAFNAGTKGNWETPEERAARQVYIVKQSSLANAIALRGPGTNLAEILATAQAMTDWVFGKEAVVADAKEAKRKAEKEVWEEDNPFGE